MSDRRLLDEIWQRMEVGDLSTSEVWADLWERHPHEVRFLLLNAFEELGEGHASGVFTADYFVAKLKRVAELGGPSLHAHVADVIALALEHFDDGGSGNHPDKDHELLERLLDKVVPLGWEAPGAFDRLNALARAVHHEWEARPDTDADVPQQPPAPPKEAQPYKISTTYAVGDRVRHPKFGVGVVEAVGEGKIDVRFEDEAVRTLVHARR